MLAMCRRDQWSLAELDLSTPPRPLSRDDELSVVQLFTDMAVIERLAGALFAEQLRRVSDPTLKAIFETFVTDEVRHSHAAQLLADHYDVHRYRTYRPSPGLTAFFPAFLDAIRELDDDVANAYITAGELILDIALLRSLNDYVADPASDEAMRLINRDESRHIAIDYHMVEHYCSPAFRAARDARPRPSLAARAKAMKTFVTVLYYARPFFQEVFFRPMDRIDPSGTRIREAFKRMQLLGSMPGAEHLPFTRFMAALQALYDDPRTPRFVGELVARVAGVEGAYLRRLVSDEEIERARRVGFERLAEEALAVKEAS
jgi:hypothetical protein